MQTEDIIGQFRTEVDDTEQPYLWGDDEVIGFVDDAQKKFARLTDYFYDGVTPSITEVAVTANVPTVTLSQRILKILTPDPYLTTSRVRLKQVKLQDLDNMHLRDDYGNFWSLHSQDIWETVTGTPRLLITDYAPGIARLTPIPTAADTLKLYVVRLPLVDITDIDDQLELTEREHQVELLNWMKWRAYSKQDTDTADMKRATMHKNLFEANCREFKIALERARRPRRAIRYGGL